MISEDNEVAPCFVGQHDGRGVVFHYAPTIATTLDYALLASLRFDPATRPASLVV